MSNVAMAYRALSTGNSSDTFAAQVSDNPSVSTQSSPATKDAPVNNSSTPATSNPPSPSMSEAFLTLLVAEIQNQDPTNPTDPTAYITQLSSMAQVAAMEVMSVQAHTNAILMSNLQVMALGKLVGDPVMVQTTTVDVAEGGVISGRITIEDASTTVNIHLTDEAGNDFDIPLGEQSPGQVDFEIDPAEYDIPPGNYQISVVTNTGEPEIPIEVAGVVNDVRIPLDGSAPVLNVSGVGEVPFTMISQFGLPEISGGSEVLPDPDPEPDQGEDPPPVAQTI